MAFGSHESDFDCHNLPNFLPRGAHDFYKRIEIPTIVIRNWKFCLAHPWLPDTSQGYSFALSTTYCTVCRKFSLKFWGSTWGCRMWVEIGSIRLLCTLLSYFSPLSLSAHRGRRQTDRAIGVGQLRNNIVGL